MRIRLQQLGNHVSLPIPPTVANSLKLGEGVEVDLVVDADRGQIIVKLAAGEVEEVAKAADFAPAVEEFLQKYAQVLNELAAL